MNIALSPELENLVQEKFKSGLYNSAGEVIQDALRLLQDRDEFDRIRLEQLRREIAIGIEQADRGELLPLDFESIKVEGRKLLAQERE